MSDEHDEVRLDARPAETDRVRLYRREALELAGYSEYDAAWIADDLSVDLHVAVELVRVKGCRPDLAARILL